MTPDLAPGPFGSCRGVLILQVVDHSFGGLHC